MTLKFDSWPWKTIGHLFYATSSFVHHFVVIGEFKLELQSGIAQFGSNSKIFRAVWPWNLTEDLEKQEGTSPKQHEALCIISSSYVNSNWSYGPETAKLGVDLCDLDLWPLTLTFCMDVTSAIGKFHDDTMMGTCQKGVTDRQTDGQTDRKYHSLSCLVAARTLNGKSSSTCMTESGAGYWMCVYGTKKSSDARDWIIWTNQCQINVYRQGFSDKASVNRRLNTSK